MKAIMFNAIFKIAPYNPPHLFVADTLYMLTASIYKKADLIKSSQRKLEWQEAFSRKPEVYQWQLLPGLFYIITIMPLFIHLNTQVIFQNL